MSSVSDRNAEEKCALVKVRSRVKKHGREHMRRKKCALVQKKSSRVKKTCACACARKHGGVCACAEKDVKKFALVQKQVAELKKHAHVQKNMAECAHAQKKTLSSTTSDVC